MSKRAIDLFRIIADGVVYTLTSADQAQIYNLETYEPTAVGRGDASNDGKISKANMEVRIALDHPLAVSLLSQWVESITTMTAFSKRTSGTETLWKGRLVNIVPDDANLKLVFESIFTSLRRSGLRARFQKSCRHALYGRGCFLDPEDFAVAGTLNAIAGTTITVPEAASYAVGYFSGGMIKAPDGTLTYVSEHSGDQLRLNRISASLAAAFGTSGPGVAVTLYPGCDHSYLTCASKFNNDDNYGGFDYIPSKNPMGGSSIV